MGKARPGDIRAGGAFYEIYADDSKINQSFKNIKKRFAGLGQSLQRMAKTYLAFSAVAGAGIGVAIKKASVFNNELERTKLLFGDAFDNVSKFAGQLEKSFGIGQGTTLAQFNKFATVLEGAGLNDNQAAGVTKNVLMGALGLSTRLGKSIDEITTGLLSGLTGSTRVLRQYGIMLDEQAVKQRAIEMGIAKQQGELSGQQRTLASISLVTEKLKAFWGDSAKFANTISAKITRIKEAFTDLLEAIGQPFVKALAKPLDMLENIIRTVTRFLSENQYIVTAVTKIGLITAGIAASVLLIASAPLVAMATKIAVILGGVFAMSSVFFEDVKKLGDWIIGFVSPLFSNIWNIFKGYVKLGAALLEKVIVDISFKIRKGIEDAIFGSLSMIGDAFKRKAQESQKKSDDISWLWGSPAKKAYHAAQAKRYSFLSEGFSGFGSSISDVDKKRARARSEQMANTQKRIDDARYGIDEAKGHIKEWAQDIFAKVGANIPSFAMPGIGSPDLSVAGTKIQKQKAAMKMPDLSVLGFMGGRNTREMIGGPADVGTQQLRTQKEMLNTLKKINRNSQRGTVAVYG